MINIKIKTLILLLFCANFSFAQSNKVNFHHTTDLDRISSEAREKEKLIFIDFYTDWCAPCKKMDKEVFTNTKVSDIINKNFISVKINAEKKRGVDLAKKYGVSAYPYFLILRSDLSVKGHILGASSAELFLDKIQVYLDSNRSKNQVLSRFQAGERTPQLINDYAFLLMKEGKEKEGYEVINDYYNILNKEERATEENWFIFKRYTLKRDNERIEDLVDSQDLFRKNLGDSIIDPYMERLFRQDVLPLANGNIKPHKESIHNLREFLSNSKLKTTVSLNSMLEIAEVRLLHANNLETFKAIKKEFPNLKSEDRFILMLNFKPNKSSDSIAINNIQEALLSKYIPEQNEYNQKMLNRIYGDLKKLKLKDGVKFKNLSLEEALSLASETNKTLFLDVYAEWCGPCKEMDRSVFPLKEVGDFFNDRFVSIKIDAEKGEGLQIRKKYSINAYPTYLFLNDNGDEVLRLIGFQGPKDLLRKTEEGLSEKPFKQVLEDYNSNLDRSSYNIEKIVKTYFETGYKNKGEQILDSLFQVLTDKEKTSQEYLSLYRYAQNDKSERMQYFIENHSKFQSLLGWYEFQELVDSIFPQLLMNQQAQFRKKQFLDKNFPYLENFLLKENSETKALLELIRLAEKQEMDNILNHLNEKIMLYKGRNRVFASYMAISVPNKGTPDQNVKLKKILDKVLEVENDPISIESFTMFRDRIKIEP